MLNFLIFTHLSAFKISCSAEMGITKVLLISGSGLSKMYKFLSEIVHHNNKIFFKL